MIRISNSMLVLSMLLLGLSSLTPGQTRSTDSEKCPGQIFGSKDVARRAKIIEYADTSILIQVATEYKFHGPIRAEAVLSRSGRVTDIQVTQLLPQNLDTFVVAAISTTRFQPAELNWHSVSQRIQFEFAINDDTPADRIDPPQAQGRLVEHLEITGNRT